jgi:hypothetical protein
MTNDNEALEMVCHICGKLTTDQEFYTIPSGRPWTHFECMLKESRKLIASGAADDIAIALDRPDGITEIRTGRQLREQNIQLVLDAKREEEKRQ